MPDGEAVAITGPQFGARTLNSATGKSVPNGFRAHDTIERDPAASIKVKEVVSEFQAELDSGENLLRPVKVLMCG